MEVWIRRCLVGIVLMVCFVGPLVSRTPFPLLERPCKVIISKCR
jgi:hypothetical protein